MDRINTPLSGSTLFELPALQLPLRVDFGLIDSTAPAGLLMSLHGTLASFGLTSGTVARGRPKTKRAISHPSAAHDAQGKCKARVFISYSRKDMAFADRLDEALKKRGFEPLIDRTDIYVFEDWWQRIQNLIDRLTL